MAGMAARWLVVDGYQSIKLAPSHARAGVALGLVRLGLGAWGGP